MQSCRPLTPSPSGAARSSACPSQVRGLAGVVGLWVDACVAFSRGMSRLRHQLSLCELQASRLAPSLCPHSNALLPGSPVIKPLDVDSEPSLPLPSLCTVLPAYHCSFWHCCYAVIKPLDVESEPGSSSGVGATVRPDCSVHLGALHGCCAAALCSAV